MKHLGMKWGGRRKEEETWGERSICSAWGEGPLGLRRQGSRIQQEEKKEGAPTSSDATQREGSQEVESQPTPSSLLESTHKEPRHQITLCP